MAGIDAGSSVLAIGGQRSYSDVCVPIGQALRADKGMTLESNGLLRVGAGATLGEIAKIILPQGWWFPVTPGTRHATIGGCIANDVHGKAHREFGSFGNHVTAIGLSRSDDRGGRPLHPVHGLFQATVGGLGLTGRIDWATIQLRAHKPFLPWEWPLDYVPYYWPLYKRLGFWQFHCVVPGLEAAQLVMKRVTLRPFLTVRKVFGNMPAVGMLSFCRPGLSISMDFLRPDPELQMRLEEIVMAVGGAVYPAKTSMAPITFRASFPRWHDFQAYIDPAFASSFSQRVGLTSD